MRDSNLLMRLLMTNQINFVRNYRDNNSSLIIFIQRGMERKPWTQEQDLALKNLVQEIGFTNWTLVAAKLSHACSGTERTGKQCRERWINHLDLTMSKKAWSRGEQKIIFQMHNAYGNKWKEIAKHLNSRAENDIKNHFYATIRKGIRRLNKLVGFAKNPVQLRKIKPSVLSKVCQCQQQLENTLGHQSSTEGVFNLILKLSRHDPSQEECEQLLEQERLILSSKQFLERLVSQNQIYEGQRALKKMETESKGNSEKQMRSEQMNMEFDISEYLCIGQQLNERQQMRPRSEGASIKQDSIFSDE